MYIGFCDPSNFDFFIDSSFLKNKHKPKLLVNHKLLKPPIFKSISLNPSWAPEVFLQNKMAGSCSSVISAEKCAHLPDKVNYSCKEQSKGMGTIGHIYFLALMGKT